MSKENLIRLYEVVAEKPELTERVHGLPDEASATETFIKIGEEQGLSFSKEEFDDWVATDRKGRFPVRVVAHGESRPVLNVNEAGEPQDLTDEQLEAVAGASVLRALVGDRMTFDRD